jgi:ABC-type transport system substrate-binding protein
VLASAAGELNSSKRAADYQSAYQLLWSNTYGDFLFENPTYDVLTSGVTGVGPTPPTWVQWGTVAVK